jgi:hypothetical protein
MAGAAGDRPEGVGGGGGAWPAPLHDENEPKMDASGRTARGRRWTEEAVALMAVHEDEDEKRRIMPLALLVARGQGATMPRRGGAHILRHAGAAHAGAAAVMLAHRGRARGLRCSLDLVHEVFA